MKKTPPFLPTRKTQNDYRVKLESSMEVAEGRMEAFFGSEDCGTNTSANKCSWDLGWMVFESA